MDFVLASKAERNAVRPRCGLVVKYSEYLFYCVLEKGHDGECHYLKYKEVTE